MAAAANEWEMLCDAFSHFARHIQQAHAVNVNAKTLRAEARNTAQLYFQRARPLLDDLELDQLIQVLDAGFKSLLELSHNNNAIESYKKQIRAVKKVMPRVASRIALNRDVTKVHAGVAGDDEIVANTLELLVAPAANSFRQAVADLADDHRISFRGPALELREALRETLDHLAPDEAVSKAEGYTLEKGRTGPTMKQKVRFILRARGRRASLNAVAENTAATIDEMVGTLTRSAYDMSSMAAHVALERTTVIQIRRYVMAILYDLLAL